MDSVAACLLPFFMFTQCFSLRSNQGSLSSSRTRGQEELMIERQNLEIRVNDLLSCSCTTCSGSARRKLKQFQSRLIPSVWFQSAPRRPPCQVQKSFKREASRDLDGPVAPLPAHSRPLSDYLAKTAKNKSQSLNLNFPKKKKKKKKNSLHFLTNRNEVKLFSLHLVGTKQRCHYSRALRQHWELYTFIMLALITNLPHTNQPLVCSSNGLRSSASLT